MSPRIWVDVDVLSQAAAAVGSVERSTSELASDVRSVQGTLDWELRAKEQFDARLRALQASVLDESHRLRTQRVFLAATGARWAATEDELIRLAGSAPGSSAPAAGGHSSTWPWHWLLGEAHRLAFSGPLSFTAAIFGLLGVEGWSRSGGYSADLFGVEHGEHSTTVYAAKAEAHGQFGAAHGSVKAYAGKAEAEYKPLSIGASGVQASAGASVSALSAEAQGEIGSKDLGLYGGADGDVLSAKASVDGGLTLDGDHGPQAGVHAKLDAALAEGSVKGGFEIMGFKFGGELKGEVGAGVEGGIGLNKDELEFDVSAALGLGGGFKFTVGRAT